MKRIAIALSFGVCTVSARGGAEPRAIKAASHAKGADPLARQERQTYARIVALADSDGNARVSEAELETLIGRDVGRQAAARFRRLDRDGDGRVVQSEVPSMAAVRFQRFDRNS